MAGEIRPANEWRATLRQTGFAGFRLVAVNSFDGELVVHNAFSPANEWRATSGQTGIPGFLNASRQFI